MIKIVIDAMGGDFAPAQQVKGSIDALNANKDVSIILVGDETQINAELAQYKYDAARLEIVHTTETIGMEEIPTKAVKTKKDSSLVVAFRLLKEGKADALVSSGSTGAVLTAGVLILGRLKGVSRPALCPAIPNYRGETTFICDCGANLECKPVNLLHFAVMASAYAEAVYGVQNPRVGLLNNGTEDHKGLPLQQEVNQLLKDAEGINYVGNVEGRELMYGDIDVMVSDGFTGNIATKAVEGCAKAISTILKREYKRNLFTKIGALFSKGVIKRFKQNLDYEGRGGAMFLGLQKAVVKGHGNSKARAFSACIDQAINAVRGDMINKMKEMIEKVNMDALAETAKQAAENGAQ
ncbi:MAG: phosphate acyltransferase PlsX [Clostridiales bacterium]|nr:phosphate acyltransferase PlsX [Clostridiales bacterium]